jgi:hypothetical protein
LSYQYILAFIFVLNIDIHNITSSNSLGELIATVVHVFTIKKP